MEEQIGTRSREEMAIRRGRITPDDVDLSKTVKIESEVIPGVGTFQFIYPIRPFDALEKVRGAYFDEAIKILNSNGAHVPSIQEIASGRLKKIDCPYSQSPVNDHHITVASGILYCHNAPAVLAMKSPLLDSEKLPEAVKRAFDGCAFGIEREVYDQYFEWAKEDEVKSPELRRALILPETRFFHKFSGDITLSLQEQRPILEALFGENLESYLSHTKEKDKIVISTNGRELLQGMGTYLNQLEMFRRDILDGSYDHGIGGANGMGYGTYSCGLISEK